MLVPLIENTFGVGERLETNLVYRPPAPVAIVPVLLAENSSTVDGTSFPFAESASPSTNQLLLMAVGCSHGTAVEVPNSISAYGLTWLQAPGVANGTVTHGSSTKRITWFYAWGAPTTGTVTIGFATSHSNCAYSVIACPRAMLAAPRQSTSNTANSTTITGTLAATLAGSMHIYALWHNAGEIAAVPATGGWTKLSDRTVATPSNGLHVAWTTSGDLTADPTWTTSSLVSILSLEVRRAA